MAHISWDSIAVWILLGLAIFQSVAQHIPCPPPHPVLKIENFAALPVPGQETVQRRIVVYDVMTVLNNVTSVADLRHANTLVLSKFDGAPSVGAVVLLVSE